MPLSIPSIPHKSRMKAHKLQYLRAISDSMDYPFQSEDGRDPSASHQELTETCVEYTDIPYWQFTNCCTDSLQIAFSMLCKVGDTVIVPAYGWRAVTNAPQFVGLNVIYCDIDETGNVSISELHRLIYENQPAAILIIHNFGTVVDVSELTGICEKYGVKIIEDAAQAFVMKEPYDYKIGSCADIVCFSFDFTKSPGTLGAGGAIATYNPDHFTKIKSICSHITNELGIGTKSYLDTTAAAVLNCDIKLIEQMQYRQRRVEIATYYINKLPYETLSGKNYIFHRFIILPDKSEKQDLINKLKSQKILAKPVYKPNTDACTYANRFYESAIELPCHQFIDVNDLNSRIEKIL